MEDRARAAGLDPLEDRDVDRPGDVVERHEDDALTRTDSGGLTRDLHSGDPDLRIVLASRQLVAGNASDLGQQRRIDRHDMPVGIDTEDLELGFDLFELRVRRQSRQ